MQRPHANMTFRRNDKVLIHRKNTHNKHIFIHIRIGPIGTKAVNLGCLAVWVRTPIFRYRSCLDNEYNHSPSLTYGQLWCDTTMRPLQTPLKRSRRSSIRHVIQADEAFASLSRIPLALPAVDSAMRSNVASSSQ